MNPKPTIPSPKPQTLNHKPRSFAFYRWWAVQRIWAVWEAFAGPFLLDTPLINVVYILLGARVSLNPKPRIMNLGPVEVQGPKL